MSSIVDTTLRCLTWQSHSMVAALDAWWQAERAASPLFEAFLDRRAPIIGALPVETSWWRVGPIKFDHLRQMRAIPPFSFGKSMLDLGHEALRYGTPWEVKPNPRWDGILLFGHNRVGPFTVVEGNHRLISAAIHGAEKSFMPADLHVNVALSLEPFKWHRTW